MGYSVYYLNNLWFIHRTLYKHYTRNMYILHIWVYIRIRSMYVQCYMLTYILQTLNNKCSSNLVVILTDIQGPYIQRMFCFSILCLNFIRPLSYIYHICI